MDRSHRGGNQGAAGEERFLVPAAVTLYRFRAGLERGRFFFWFVVSSDSFAGKG